MLEKIEHYWLIASTFIIAVLAFIFVRNSSKIKNLQEQLILNKLDAKLDQANNQLGKDQDSYDQAIKKYNSLRDSYNQLYGPKSPS